MCVYVMLCCFFISTNYTTTRDNLSTVKMRLFSHTNTLGKIINIQQQQQQRKKKVLFFWIEQTRNKRNVLDKTNQKHLKHAYASDAYPIVYVCICGILLSFKKNKKHKITPNTNIA